MEQLAVLKFKAWQMASYAVCICLRRGSRLLGLHEERVLVACNPLKWTSHVRTISGYIRAFGVGYALRAARQFVSSSQSNPLEDLVASPTDHFQYQPQISVIVRFSPEMMSFLPAMLRSVKQQTYTKWNLVFVAPESLMAEAAMIAADHQAAALCEDASLEWVLSHATGEFCLVLNPLCLLEPAAFASAIATLNQSTSLNLIVGEVDYFLVDGDYFGAGVKHFSSLTDEAKARNLEGFCLIRKKTLLEARALPGNAEDNRLILAAASSLRAEIPSVLCHRRIVDGLAKPAEGGDSVKAIAFYLPQFHPIPENDQWWGEGFTEWTNVRRGRAMFAGHDQPRRPGELGYYDLVDEAEILPRQMALAQEYDIHGFCFYYYWFNGRRLLQKPLERILSDSSLQLPFCVCWANESWTRAWDGLSKEVLIEQTYSREADEQLILDLLPLFRDPRYIRVNDAPMLVIYNAGGMKDPAGAFKTYRRVAAENGIAQLHIVICQVFGWKYAPADYGADAAVEFPPHCIERRIVTHLAPNCDSEFEGQIISYDGVVKAVDLSYPGYPLYRTAMLAWDNTARKQNRAHVFQGFTPYRYKKWLTACRAHAQRYLPPDGQFLFINAWNEWAEGTYLEPDATYGRALLQTTAQVLTASAANATFPRLQTEAELGGGTWPVVLFVTHDMNMGGAQVLLLSMLRYLQERTSIRPKLLAISGGNIEARFVSVLGKEILRLDESAIAQQSPGAILNCIRTFAGPTLSLVYGNSVVSCAAYDMLSHLNVPFITHVHELEQSIRNYASVEAIEGFGKFSTHHIACSQAVAENLKQKHSVAADRIDTICAFIDPANADPQEAGRIRRELNIPAGQFIVAGCGIGLFWRKGADLFIQTARHLIERGAKGISFIWIGDFPVTDTHPEYGAWSSILQQLRRDGLEEQIRFLGMKASALPYLRAADVFFCPSREDPFPLVCLEAASLGKPVICFAGAGGMPDFVQQDAGYILPMGDTEAAADLVASLAADRPRAAAMGASAAEKLHRTHCTAIAVPKIIATMRCLAALPPRVSIIVPVYNGERFIHRRLKSIFEQSYRDFEVIVLDDGSTDNSIAEIQKFAHHPELTLVRNQKNLGVFGNWLAGVARAKGQIIWIAEQDDQAAPEFLQTLLRPFRDDAVVLSYCSSSAELEDGTIVPDYFQRCRWFEGMPYAASMWTADRQGHGLAEIRNALAIKNTIPNASAVLMRRSALKDIQLQDLADYRCGGDWYIYMRVLEKGSLAYCARNLNIQARHESSVVGSSRNDYDKTLKDYHLIHTLAEKSFSLPPETFAAMDHLVWNQLALMWPDVPEGELRKVYSRASVPVAADSASPGSVH